ncbi:MAG: response regulator [Chloroflexota bacterium]
MDTHPSRALVVDDEASIRTLCQSVLERMGFFVETCESGALALHTLANETFDLLLIDLRMPDVDGVDVLRQVRQFTNHMAIVVITGHATLEDTAETTLLGAQGILLKPFSLNELRSVVHEVLRRRRDDRAAAQLVALHPLIGVSEQFLNELDLPRLCEHIVVTAQESVQATQVLLMLRNDRDETINIAASSGLATTSQAVLHEQVAQWVITHRRPLLLHRDQTALSDLETLLWEDSLQAVLSVPLTVRGEVLGVLYAGKFGDSVAFTQANQDVLTLLAGQVAIALENAKLYSLAQSRADRFRRLNALSTALTATLDVNHILEVTAQHLYDGLSVVDGRIMLCEEADNFIDIGVTFDLTETVVVPNMAVEHNSLTGMVLRDGQPRLMRVGDQSHLLAHWEKQFAVDGNITLLCVALSTDKGISGIILVASPKDEPFNDEDLQFLVAVASPVALAIEKARLYTTIARSEAHYRALLNHAQDAVLLLDKNATSIIEVNPAAVELAGYTHDKLIQLDPTQLVVLPVDDGIPSRFSDFIRNGIAEFEAQVRTRDERTIPVAVGISEVVYDDQHYLLLIARDISERQRLAQQLTQTEKLAGMGRLAASLAHELNNPLHGLRNSLHLVLSRPLDEGKRQTLLHKARDEVEQLISLVQRILDFYRPSREGMRPTSLYEVLENVVELTMPRLQHSEIVVERMWNEQLPRVMGIGSHLKQVFLNLILNAIDAMPHGGRLCIRAYMQEAENDADQQQVVIEFVDSGSGIAESEIQKIFEPFYTTRTQHTGLGLAISYSIVEQHQGMLSVDTTTEGTVFSVVLPAL